MPPQTYQSRPHAARGPPPAARGPPPPTRRVPVTRGPAAGPRTDLSKADTSHTTHQLYVKVEDGNKSLTPNELKNRDLTLAVLKFIHDRLPIFQRMGLQIQVNRIRDVDLANPRLTDAMKRKGIVRLPALTTPTNLYLGVKEIEIVYKRNLEEFAAFKRQETAPVTGMTPEDDLDAYYQEMSGASAWKDAVEGGGDNDEGIGESIDMMDAYRGMMQSRESMGRKRSHRTPTYVSDSSSPSTSSRPDNIDDAQTTIDRMIRDIDSSSFDRAFSGGGGDSLIEDGGPGGSQDNLMERAFWSNMQETDA